MNIFENVAEKSNHGEEFVLVTIVETTGSVPGKSGFKMIVTPSAIKGTVGGGALEKFAIQKARELLETKGTNSLIRIDLTNLGMVCGGETSLFMEPFFAKNNLWIFGGGHIAKALVPIIASAGFSVTVADNRPEFVSKERFPLAHEAICGSYEDLVKQIPAKAFVVLVTHGHKHDTIVLKEAVKQTPALPYIGMIGSTKKVNEAFDILRQNGCSDFDNIYAPIGLDIGGDSPEEIAVAIAAELVGVAFGKRDLPHCRNRVSI